VKSGPEDLYYRINVIAPPDAPAAGKREDIPVLANHFPREV